MAKNTTPKYNLFHVRSYEHNGEKRGFWTKIGAVWENRDGSLNLDAQVPVVLTPGETFQLRPYDEHRRDNDGGERALDD